MDSKRQRLTEAILSSLQKHPNRYDTRDKTVRKVMANQIAIDVLQWYKDQKEKNDNQ